MRSEYRLGASNGPQALWETVAFGRQWALVTCSANSDMNFAHVHDAKNEVCACVCVCVKPRFQGHYSLLFLLPFIVNVQFATAGGPWAHGWHGPTKTHPCCREKTYLHKFLTYSKELMRLFKHSVALTFHSCGFASQVLSIHLKG